MSAQPNPARHPGPSTAPSSSAASPTGPPHSSSAKHRVLACIACQQRKVKCDRKFPCANCVRSRVQCVPAALVPRPRRRRFPERELLERLRHYEELLRKNGIGFEPLHREGGGVAADGGSGRDSGQEHAGAAGAAGVGPGGVRAADSKEVDGKYDDQSKNFWHAMLHQGDGDYESDWSADEEPKTAVTKMWDQLYHHREDFPFGTRTATLDLPPLHPGPADIFRLWQIYLDNVNPLLNVTHSPTLQPRLVEAAGNPTGIAPPLEALMFGIYSMAIRSLSPVDCEAAFLHGKDDLLLRYQSGCQQALMNCGFLRTNSRDCLTAYYLYLMSMAFNTHPQSLYVMLGMATRIAQRMGLHHEATLSKYSPFEAEMRRRLWWSLVLFESRIGEQSEKGGARNSTLSPIWDCKPPTNISDSDLRPEMKTSAVAGSRCTEAIFSVVRSQLADYLRFADFFLDFTNPALKHVARAAKMGSVEDGGGGDRISVLETEMEDKYIRFCDPTNPVQLLTIGTTRTFFARCRLLCHLSSHAGPSLPHMSEGEMDTATLHAIRMLEGDTMATASPSTKRYQWFMASYFPLPAYLRVAQEIRARPLGPRVDRAWGALTDNFAARMVFKLGYGAGAFTPLNRIIVQAWDAYEGALVREGRSRESIAVPGIVGQVRQLAAEYEMVSTPAGGSPGTDDFNMGFGEFQGTGLPMLFGGPGFPDTMGQESFLAVGDAAGLGGVPPQQAMGSMNLNDVGWYYSQ